MFISYFLKIALHTVVSGVWYLLCLMEEGCHKARKHPGAFLKAGFCVPHCAKLTTADTLPILPLISDDLYMCYQL